ncbi:MAG: hypothetical protein KatS3mg118_2538 [Paracoccaceae bacterium]|nr:MAG: hypothetical protein KatS3mg118_2538 [Paracoccaceae bacterium]
MLTVRELKPRVLEIVLSGVVDAGDIETMKRALTPVLEGEGRIGLVVHLEDLEDITRDALIADARFEFSMLPKWGKVARVAVITDRQAFQALLDWLDPVLPMIAFRSFPPDQVAAAESWAAELPPAPPARGPGLRVVGDGDEGILILEIDGRLGEEDADRAFAAFEQVARRHGKVRLLVRVKDYEGFEPGLLFDRGVMRAKLDAVGKIDRYAIVGAPGWMRAMVGALAPVMPFAMRVFDAGEEAAAQEWLRGR